MSLFAYLSQDRLRALANKISLPNRTSGSALFADISGFTALTETLSETLGTRRGAEEMTNHLSRAYNALISEVEHFGGSVIDFAGDAVLCWFDASQGASEVRATSCALALQKTMNSFEPSGIKRNIRYARYQGCCHKWDRASVYCRRFIRELHGRACREYHCTDILGGTNIA